MYAFSTSESTVPATGSRYTVQYRPRIEPPEIVTGSPSRSATVGEPRDSHYSEIVDIDQVPAVEEVFTIKQLSITRNKTAFNKD